MFDDFQRPIISDENIQKSITEVLNSFNKKLEKSGKGALISPVEILGKLTEEYLEVEDEVHDERLNDLKNELIDVVVTGLWGIASIMQSYEK